MKISKLFQYICIPMLSLGLLLLSGCSSKEFDEVTDLGLTRCLEPMNLGAKVSSTLGDVVTFSWDVTKDAQNYLLTICNDADMTDVYLTETVSPSDVPLQKKLEADRTFYFSVQAKADGKQDSKVALYGKSVKTFAVKDNLFLKLSDRTASSVSLTWSKEVADYTDVDRIVYRLPGNEETEQTYNLTADDITAATAVVSGLEAATEYEFILFFKSASRGQVNAWTAPDVTTLTPVNSLAGLQSAVQTSGAQIYLKLEGSPYDIEAMDISTGFSLIGELDADGNGPVLTGEFHISDAWNGQNLFFENVTFDGAPTAASPSGFGFALQNKNGGAKEGKDIGNVTYKNCVITNYSKGLLYEWGKPMVLGDVLYDSCDLLNINEDGTVGGDVFDIRQATTIKSVSFINNTIAQGMRTFVRLDPNVTVGALTFENNTLFNLCFVDNANNAGIFGLQVKPGSFSFKNNLFLNMTGKSVLAGANAKYIPASDLGVSASNNWFFDVPSTYFTDNFTLAQAAGTILEETPCYNAPGGLFNILAGSDISGKEVGASKWWTPYVEEPEDLTLNTLTSNKTWNLSNAKYFSGTIKKEMVRDDLYLHGSEENAIVVANGMLNFQNAAVTDRAGVPADGYIAFKVSGPGSVIIKAADPESQGRHFIVGVGKTDGSDIALKGGASAQADMPNAQKIVITSITEESLVYVYPSGPVSLEKLAWSTDVTPVNTALPTPDPTADPASITKGNATDITVSWPAVEGAGSYTVVFKSKTYTVKDATEYVIGGTTTGMLDAGSYKVEVFANPGADDIYNTESAAGVATFAVLPSGGGGDDETIVKNVDELLAAIGAGKDAITLLPGEYKLGGPLTVTSSLNLYGPGAVVYGGFVLSGEVNRFDLIGLTCIGSDAENKADIFINLDNAAGVKATDISVVGCVVDGYAKSVIYASNTADVFEVENITFNDLLVKNMGTGQGVFDLRNGKYSQFMLQNSTVTGGRDFLRIDAPCSIHTVVVDGNTLYNLNDSKNAGGLFSVRATPVVYEVIYNVVANIANSISGRATAMVPKLKKNVWYNLGESFFTGCITADNYLDGQGVNLSVDPFKDAANGDYTLTNAIVASLGVGADRWNPTTITPNYDNWASVKNTDELLAAIDAGKTSLYLDPGEYTLTEPLTLTAGMNLSGSLEATTLVVPEIKLAEGELGVVSLDNMTIKPSGGNNLITVDAASVVKSLKLTNLNVDGVAKSLFYGNAEGSSFGALVLDNVMATNLGGGQGTIDIRKGTYEIVTIQNSTIVGGRDFIRADADRVTGAINIVNNTFDGVTLNNGNGVLYVRSTPTSYVFKNNLFLNENGTNNMLSKASGVTVPNEVSNNYFYNCTAEKFWTGLINQDVALANGGAILLKDPVKDAANLDYTLVNALCISRRIGSSRWNNMGDFYLDTTVSDVESLYSAISAGIPAIQLTPGVYDLRTVAEGGILTTTAPLQLYCEDKSAEIIGAFKLGAGTTSFEVDGLVFNGADKALGNAFEIGEAIDIQKVMIWNCEIKGYNKSVFYGNGDGSQVNVFDFSRNQVHGFGTGQGMLDIRKGTYAALNVSRNTFYDGGRDFIRCDAGIASSIAIENNTFAACSIDAGNGLLWVRSCADAPENYIVQKNLFLNLTGDKTVLAKTGATVPTMSSNYFFNVGAAFWGGAINQETATANGGVLDADPCNDSATFNFMLKDATLRAADIGDPRWNPSSPNYKKKK